MHQILFRLGLRPPQIMLGKLTEGLVSPFVPVSGLVKHDQIH